MMFPSCKFDSFPGGFVRLFLKHLEGSDGA